MREVLGDNLHLIRFPAMSRTEFIDTVVPEDILTIDEGDKVFRYFASECKKPENVPFEPTPRYDTSPQTLIIPAPYSDTLQTLRSASIFNTVLSCTLSKPLCLMRIYVHASPESFDDARRWLPTARQGLRDKELHPTLQSATQITIHQARRQQQPLRVMGSSRFSALSVYERGDASTIIGGSFL